MKGTSVPKVLLTLGAGCLLVAAMVFLAVTWSVLGVGGRTATLVAFTAIAGGFTRWTAGRGLRGGTESLGLVTLGLLSFDLIGANSAGWFGDPSNSTFTVILGAVLAAAATGACLVLRRTPSGAFTSGEVMAGIATAAVAVGLTSGSWGADEGRALVATVVTLAGAVALNRLSLVVGAVGAGLVGSLCWLALAAMGLVRLGDHASISEVWGDLQAWPALAAAAIAGALVAVRRLPLLVRQGAGATAVALVVAVVVAPSWDESENVIALTVVVVLLLAAAALWALPKPWSATASLTLLVSGTVSLGLAAALGGVAIGRLTDAAVEGGRFLDRLPAADDFELDAWLLPLVVLALCAGVAAVARFSGANLPWLRIAPIVAVPTVVLTAASYSVPIWLVVAALLGSGIAFALRRLPVESAIALVAGLWVSIHSDGLMAIALGLVMVGATWLLMKDQRDEVQLASGIIAQLALGASVWTWVDLLDRPGEWAAAFGIGAVAVVALAVRKLGLEIGAGAATGALFLAGASVAPEDQVWTWVAVYLTIAGAATCAQSLLRDDRRELGWVGGLLLAMATWVRLGDIGVHEPEPYTLPSALALVVVGLLYLRRKPGASTLQALSPGLALALVPSLLWVLAEPGTIRSAILGLGCLVLVVAGAQLRWTAPLVIAGAVGALVVLRYAAPYVQETVHPWILFGFAGVLLVAMGVTWEQRVREARRVFGYVRALR